MKEYKIALENINTWDDVLCDIFKWNANNDLILFAFKGEFYTLHFRLFQPLSLKNDNETINFNILPAFTNHKFHELNHELDIKQHNVIMAIHYIENIKQDYLIVKKNNLKNFNFPINKEIILMELHTDMLSRNSFISRLDGKTLDFIFDTDFSQFNKKPLTIVKFKNTIK